MNVKEKCVFGIDQYVMKGLVNWDLIVKYNKTSLIDHQFKKDYNQWQVFINDWNIHVTNLRISYECKVTNSKSWTKLYV